MTEKVQNKPRKRKMPNIGTLTIVLATLFLVILLSLTSDTFFDYNNIYSLFFHVSIELYVIIGLAYLMIMGEIDLSVGGVYGFIGVLVGFLQIKMGVPLVVAMLISLVVAALIGFINGFVVVKFKVNSMMVTLGMMNIALGLESALSSALNSALFKSDYREFIKFRIGTVHWTVILMFICVIILEILLHKTTLFKKMYYIGNNLDSAKIYGIKANKIKLVSFIITAVLAGFAGIIANSRIGHAYPTTGQGLEFTMVTAAVLGGASLYGGKGSIFGSAMGMLFLAVLNNGMIIYSIDPYLQQTVMGLILILAIFVDTKINRVRS